MATPAGLLKALKQHLNTPLYANAYYLMSTSVVRSLSGVPFWMLAARLYAPAEVGLASAVLSAVALLATISGLGLGFGLIRFLPDANGDANDLLNSSFTLVVASSGVLASIFLIGLPLWSAPLAVMCYQTHFVVLFIPFATVATLSALTNQVFIAHRAARFSLYTNAIGSILKVPLLVPFAMLSGGVGIAFSVWTPMLLTLAVALVWFIPRIQHAYQPSPVFRGALIGGLMRYSLANYGANLLSALPATLLPLMVLSVLGAVGNAYFFAAWTMIQPLLMVAVAISFSLFAEGSHYERALPRTVGRAWVLALLILSAGVTTALLFGHRLLLVFGAQYSQNATTLLRLLSLCTLPAAIRMIGFAAYRVRKQLRRILVISTVDVALSVAFAYCFLRVIGLDGIGLGLLIGQVPVAALVACTARRRRSDHTSC